MCCPVAGMVKVPIHPASPAEIVARATYWYTAPILTPKVGSCSFSLPDARLPAVWSMQSNFPRPVLPRGTSPGLDVGLHFNPQRMGNRGSQQKVLDARKQEAAGPQRG